MRYYSIVLTDPTSGKLIAPKSLSGAFSNASYASVAANGAPIPGAMNVELDVPVTAFATPMGSAFVRVWGVSLDEIGQASDLNGAAISVYAGMSKGLPLANPKQSGLIVAGYVFQAFGNWIGTDQTLDLVIVPNPTKSAPPNIVLDWKKGTALGDALKTTLSTAYPGYAINVATSANLVLPNDEAGYYSTLEQLAAYVKEVSQSILGTTDYNGVDVVLKETSFDVFDGTTQTAPKALAFQDMIGQPTWIGASEVQAKFVMRADLNVGDYVKFPTSPVVSNAASVSPLVNEKLTFQGTFLVKNLRHVGNFRQADAASWVTVVDAASTKPVPAAA